MTAFHSSSFWISFAVNKAGIQGRTRINGKYLFGIRGNIVQRTYGSNQGRTDQSGALQ